MTENATKFRALSGLSHFLHASTESLPDRAWNIAAVMELDGSLTRSALVRLVKQRLTSQFSRLRSIIRGDSIKGFSLEDLGKYWSPSRNIRVSNSDCSFEKIISEPFKPYLPEWEFILCNRHVKPTILFSTTPFLMGSQSCVSSSLSQTPVPLFLISPLLNQSHSPASCYPSSRPSTSSL
jgi:hypothetical protein